MTAMFQVLYIGSMNTKKAREMQEILAGLPIEVRPLPSTGIVPVEEDGTTFAENASRKALALAEQLQAAVVADDSGLEVDALGGRPGVWSARYGGPLISDDQRCRMLLEELRGVPGPQRTARFRCCIALAVPGRVLLTAAGTVEGRIALAPRGTGGFGYDPIFLPQGHDRTFAEMSAAEKHAISHRGQALRHLRGQLEQLLASSGQSARACEQPLPIEIETGRRDTRHERRDT